MASTTAFPTAAKLAFARGEIQAGHVYKMALYSSSATHSASTTAYSTTNEVTGTGYTAGGVTLTGYASASSGTVAYLDWSDASWATATFTAASAIIYDDTASPKVVLAVLDFGGNQSVTGATFTVQFPTADSTSAIIRLG